MSTASIQNLLFENQDLTYAEFQSKLVPTLAPELFIGVRVPQLRRLAKSLSSEASQQFLQSLPHQYYDENMLHAILISEIKDFEACLVAVEDFLPFVDNWAVCDILSPKVFKKNRAALLARITHWATSALDYQQRFAIIMLMSHFLDEDFKPEYLAIPAAIRSDHYYVNMGIAWFFATALAKQWDTTISYLEGQRLSPQVHNKAIQKARESFRITAEQKHYLASLRLTIKKIPN